MPLPLSLQARPRRALAAALLVSVAFFAPLRAVQAPGLQVGDRAPAFTLPGSDGKMHSLSEHLGVRPVVLAWFPRVVATL